ncbi:MAG: D-alanyl-D-alanine carboxypeptidase [Cyclobacteriaceae bacterium]
MLSVLDSHRDSIPSFAFSKTGKDSIALLPLADPTFLHPKLSNRNVLDKLNQYKKLSLLTPKNNISAFGPGWAWDDYFYSFQPERSYYPIYGNVVNITFDSVLVASPSFFNSYIDLIPNDAKQNALYRDPNLNIFNTYINEDSAAFFRTIPFKTSLELYQVLLKDTIPNIVFNEYDNTFLSDTIYSQRTIDVLATMMKSSDNFLAEQLLIQSGIINGSWNTDAYRNRLLTKWSTFLTHQPQWYDGSGLSRYNLITPKSLVEILHEIYQQLSFDEIKYIFPVGGESGTIRNYYKATTPYVIAKTGTLKNNHCLSGYLVTASGKTLIFSFMNNHYIGSSHQAKLAMEKVLVRIRDKY